MRPPKPLILFIDAYDSFSNNIISLLSTTLEADIRTIHIDNPALSSDEALHAELRHYAAVVCGPGPGNPGKEEDVGIMRRIWRLQENEMVPVLGICLGFQSLCWEFGGSVGRLKGPQHGIVSRITHIGAHSNASRGAIFEGVGEVYATLYQSLCADIGQDLIGKDEWETAKWKATERCPELLPLAWVEHDLAQGNDSGIMDEKVLVGVQHKTKPFWALQYHPESICTNEESTKVITNWFGLAQAWNKQKGRIQVTSEGPIEGQFVTRESLLSQNQRKFEQDTSFTAGSTKLYRAICHSRTIDIPARISIPEIVETIQDLRQDQIILESSNANENYTGGVDVRGRYSVIGLDIEQCMRVEYTAGKQNISISYPRERGQRPETVHLNADSQGGIWPYLAHYLDERQVKDGSPESPFWGGFMGYTTYELGLEGIDVSPNPNGRQHSRPDLCFAWVEKSLVVDHLKNRIYLQQLAPSNASGRVGSWMDSIIAKLEAKLLPEESYDPYTITFSNLPGDGCKNGILDRMAQLGVALPLTLHVYPSDGPYSGFATAQYEQPNNPEKIAQLLNNSDIAGRNIRVKVTSQILDPVSKHSPPPAKLSSRLSHPAQAPAIDIKSSVLSTRTPLHSIYESKVLSCQSSIRAGDSYELCLTDQTVITLSRSTSPSTPTPWSIYQTLRTKQPAPFASYLKLGPLTFISASPERFLTYTPTTCELRPMKGTVRKSSQVSTLEQAKKLLDVPKEKAENLMIVDLVRHDLHGVCGAGRVQVPRLMVVEEYKSVFQMISIVRGSLPQPPPPTSTPPSSSSSSYSASPTTSASSSTDLIASSTLASDGVHGNERLKATRDRYTGLDVLSASLPPGSMTGAPKKRSCEILQLVEGGRERSLYSGVVGYADVGGRGDWSVSIRCLFKWDDDEDTHAGDAGDGEDARGGAGPETWHIGAGGAVTTLSTAVGEREEMLTKLEGTLGLFR
ncbi:uncharacterized protein L3040_008486 [Drepanopeziza brunnea f. sp. 'multigermtubi']|uniref:uncharacterized protein n=1 Tax=Drepanopeziza brunnea f. sp. 'multigermtubi' TaxID=698441 RepID=UPI002385CDC6|nr:hypothetical protein L3040_008486 [Drepanopeziza brunnea f. sp. 'multigermtubi']